MSTLNDVQNALANVIDPIIYPNGDDALSILGNRVVSVAVTVGGSGYTTATISFTGGNGQGAMAQAVISGGVITQIIVPNGAGGFNYTSAPTVVITGNGSGASATATISPIKVSIAPGDFLKQNLDPGLANNDAFIDVFAVHGMTRNTTRFRREYSGDVVDVATLTMTVSNDTVTVGGTVTPGQVCTVIDEGVGYAYKAVNGDTLTTIATQLAALIPGATSFGAVITVTGHFHLVGRVSVPGGARRILHSQESVIRVRIICAHNEIRDILAYAVQIGVGANGYFLQMPDLISAFIKPYNSGIAEINNYEMSNAFIRNYLYLVEYHTVQVNTFQTISDPYSINQIDTLPIS